MQRRGGWGGEAGEIAAFPIRAQQAREQIAAFLVESSQGFDCDAHHVGIGLGAPPLLIRHHQLGRAPPRVQRVDVGNDDVVNGLVRAANFPEVRDVSGVIVGLDLLPRKELAADDHVRFYQGSRGAVGNCAAPRPLPVRGAKPPDGQRNIRGQREHNNESPAHTNQ